MLALQHVGPAGISVVDLFHRSTLCKFIRQSNPIDRSGTGISSGDLNRCSLLIAASVRNAANFVAHVVL